MIDLIVVGGGPAGLATALYAARAGLETVVFEPRASPIDKACGEGLMPGAVRSLAALGVRPNGPWFRGIRYLDGQRSAEALFRHGVGLGVRRTVLHEALMTAAIKAGVKIHVEPVGEIEQDYRSVRAGGLTARYLAAADGLHSRIARSLGLVGPPDQSRRWGLRAHWPVTPWTNLVEVYWSPRAEAYVTPVGSDLVGVAVLSGEKCSLEQHLRGFPELLDRLGGASHGKVLGAGPLRHRTIQRVAGRVLLVGDASGYVDALTGEGIAVSLACARALVSCVAADRPQHYEVLWRRRSRRYRALTSGLLWASGHSMLRRSIVPAAQRLPRAFEAIVDQLAR